MVPVSTIHRTQFSIIGDFGLRFTAAYTLNLFCSLLFVVVVDAGRDKQYSLMRGGLCDKLHRQLLCLHVQQSSIQSSQILAENRGFCLPQLHLMSPLGGPRRNTAMFAIGKLERFDYIDQMVKKFEDYVHSFDRIHERGGHPDGRTDGRTDTVTPHDSIWPRLSI